MAASVDPFPNVLVSMFALLLTGPLAFLALCLNFLFFAVLYHGHRYFSQKFFYIAARHLQIADLISIIAQLAIAVPIMALPPDLGEYYTGTDFVEFLLCCETLAHMATFHFVALQAFGQLHNLLLFQHSEKAIHQLNTGGTFICILIWIWLTVLLFQFGISQCAKRFSAALFYFYDSCYSEHSPKAGGHAALNIWLAVLLFLSFAVYLIGINTFQRKIANIYPSSAPPRRGSISVSVIGGQPTQLSLQSQVPSDGGGHGHGRPQQNSRPKTSRKQMVEMFKSKASLRQGFFMALSLSLRFLGFYAFPWIGVSLFGSGINALNERAMVNVLGNALILLSICAHQWVYWSWNLRVRTLTDEVLNYLWKKMKRQSN